MTQCNEFGGSRGELTQQEFQQALKGLRQPSNRCPDGGKEGRDNAKDGVEEVLEETEDAREDGGYSAHDGADQISDRAGDGRHVEVADRLGI